MLKRIWQYITPPEIEDQVQHTRARSNFVVVWLFILLSLLSVGLSAVNNNVTFVLVFTSGVLFFLLLGALIARGYIAFSSFALPSIALILIVGLIVADRGLLDSSSVGFLFVLILAGFLIGRNGPLIFMFVTMLTIAVLAFLELQGIIPSTEPPLTAIDVANLLIFVLLSTAMLEVTIRRMIETLEQSTVQQQALREANEELVAIRASLEEQVFSRTANLETVATLSEQLNQILNLEQLLTTLVNQVKNRFNFYHVHLYLVDDQRRSLNLASGSGEAGRKMLAKGHAIPFNAPTSLVARSARNKEIVYVPDVRADPDWLYNPLLPDTRSEMAVPIVLENQAVGVLDVQDDAIGGLDEVDGNVLRSLANQVAVAIRNARQFDNVQQALAEAQNLQQQYQQRAWQSAPVKPPRYVYQAGGLPFSVPELDNELIQLENFTAQQAQPSLLSLADLPFETQFLPAETENEAQASPTSEITSQVLLVPIVLQGKLVGKMQFLNTNPNRQWTEEEVGLLRTVADQVAQSADNLRLFEETRQRASREQAIREITTRLRAAPNLDLLVRTATEELGRRLSLSHAHLELGLNQASSQPKSTNGHTETP